MNFQTSAILPDVHHFFAPTQLRNARTPGLPIAPRRPKLSRATAMTTATSLPLLRMPPCDPTRARAWNAVAGTHRRIAFTLEQQPFTLHLRHLDQDSSGLWSPRLSIRVKAGPHLFALGLGSLPPEGFMPTKLQGLDFEALPADIAAMVLESACEPWWRLLESTLRVSCHIQDVAWNAGPVEAPNLFAFTIERHSVLSTLAAAPGASAPTPSGRGTSTARQPPLEALQGILGCDHAGLDKIAAPLAKAPAAPCPDAPRRFGGISATVHVLLGHSTLAPADFGSLDFDDLILIDDFFLSKDGLCRVKIMHGPTYPATYKGSKVTITSLQNEPIATPTPMATPPANAATSATPAPGTGALEQIPIQIVFEAGELQVPYSQLLTMQPGYVFELPALAERPISIRANGMIVGRGELLQLGDRIGVRITEFIETTQAE
ncbi:YscQ/HrcQ family type III secretion apparatus protein [Verrucomicrobia bacterium LW23]|nr:YscQ/HrcQ family type III secretion apparatus protein [Verrucomicrobia bacterium LW23]